MQHHVTLFALKILGSLYYVISSKSHVVNYFSGLWGTGIENVNFWQNKKTFKMEVSSANSTTCG